MRKLMWLLSAIALWTVTPAAQAQFGPLYGPRATRPYAPGIHGVRDPFGPRVRGIPGMPSAYDPFGRPGFPMGRQPWMPPTAQDILNQHYVRAPILGRTFSPWANNDPLARFGVPGGMNVNPTVPGVRIEPMVPTVNSPPIQPLKFDPKLVTLTKPPAGLKDFEAKTPAKPGGGGPPAWLHWQYAVGVFVLAMVGGLLKALIRSNTSES